MDPIPMVHLDNEPETDRNRTGHCHQAQADGVPCPHPDCLCETCARFLEESRERGPDGDSSPRSNR